MKYFLTLFLIVIITGYTKSTPFNDPSKTGNFSEEKVAFSKDTFPFQMIGKHIVIRAIMNDSVELSLLLDTGAQYPSFDSTFIAKNKNKLHLQLKPAHSAIGTPSGIIKQSQKISGIISINAFAEKQNFSGVLMVADLRKSSLNVDGIFPVYLLFNNKIVLMDMQHRYFRMISQDTLNNLKSHFSVFPLLGDQYSYFTVSSGINIDEVANHSVKMNGEFILDFGAPGFLYLYKIHPLVAAAIHSDLKTRKIKGLSINGKDTVLSEVLIANQITLLDSMRFKNVKINLLNFKTNAPKQIGLLGNEFFKKFVIILDYRNKQFYLQPGSDYSSPGINSNLGLNLSRRTESESYIVTSIYDPSLISNSEIRLGDSVIEINGNLTERMTEQEIDFIEHSPVGTILDFKIKRGQDIFHHKISVRDLW
ncbi:MAG: hypothetical protein Q8867_05835 [Bacteroidota bacterium]|nr:hypothetical protein [Bacteroidota bacterium]